MAFTHFVPPTFQIDPILWQSFINFDILTFSRRIEDFRKFPNAFSQTDQFGKNILHYILESPAHQHTPFAITLFNFFSTFPKASNIHLIILEKCANGNNCLHFLAFSANIQKVKVYENYIKNNFPNGSIAVLKNQAKAHNRNHKFPRSKVFVCPMTGRALVTIDNTIEMNIVLNNIRKYGNSVLPVFKKPTVTVSYAAIVKKKPALEKKSDVPKASIPKETTANSASIDIKQNNNKKLGYLGTGVEFFDKFPFGFFTHLENQSSSNSLDQKSNSEDFAFHLDEAELIPNNLI